MNNKPGAGLVALASEGSMPDAGRNMPLACNGGIAFLGVFRTHNMVVALLYEFVGLVRIWTKKGRFCSPKANMKHLKHPEHLKHLKHFLWMFGL